MFEIGAGGGGGTRLSDRLNSGNRVARPSGNSARNALSNIRNRVNSTFGSKPAPNMSLNSSGHHISQPIKKFSDGVTAYYDPVVNSTVSAITGSDKYNLTKNALDKKKKPKPRVSSDSGGSGAPSHTSAKKSWDYYEAPLAEKYGFGKATAYQEALANTSYRREMEDMRKAGLNPSVVYGSHSSSGADSNIYPREGSSGGSGGYGGSGGSGRRYGGRRSSNYAFSGAAYYGLMFAAGALTAAVTHNVGAGMAASGLMGTALKALNGFFKR